LAQTLPAPHDLAISAGAPSKVATKVSAVAP
jgi:hypothetical protein